MRPKIISTKFGSITIQNDHFPHDVIIRLDGMVEKRKKKLSKKVYGTSHIMSIMEAEHLYEDGIETLIIGTGQFDRVRLSDEAADYFEDKLVKVILESTPNAINRWNKAEGKTIGLFHVTC